MKINDLINRITPIYNSYQKGKSILSPTQLLILMWEIGDLLDIYIKKNNIAPHTLYRVIYGKSEGSTNIIQRSYIAREFLSRSYRISQIFKTKEDLQKTLPSLTAINHFREAMPFFDNPKYKLGQKPLKELLDIINSTINNKQKELYVKCLRNKKIRVKNPRTQKLIGMNEDKTIFINFYNEVYGVIKMKNYQLAIKKILPPTKKILEVLSLNCGAISTDGLKMKKFKLPNKIDTRWRNFSELILKLISKENPIERRRFRRIIPPEKMLSLSEMIYALTSPILYNNYKV